MRSLPPLLVSLLVPFLVCSGAHAASLVRFTPEGKLRDVKEVSAQFSEPMTALGDAEVPSPFDQECNHTGHGRWVDPSTWKFEFEAALPAGARCTFRLKKDLRTAAGTKVDAHAPLVVEASGLAVRLNHYSFEPVTPLQIFVLGFNAPVDPDQALKAVHCELGGQSIGPAVAPTTAALDSPGARDELKQRLAGWVDRQSAPDPARSLMLQCPAALTEGASGEVVVAAGLTSRDGMTLDHEERLPFKVQPPLTMTVTCERTAAKLCQPDGLIKIAFNRSLGKEDAKAVRLKLPDGSIRDAAHTDSMGREFNFYGSIPQLATLHVDLPASVRASLDRPDNPHQSDPEIRTAPLVTEWLAPHVIAVLPADRAPRFPLAVPDELAGQRHTIRVYRIDPNNDEAVRAAIYAAADYFEPTKDAVLAKWSSRVTNVPLPPPSSDPQRRTALPLPGKGLYVLQWPTRLPPPPRPGSSDTPESTVPQTAQGAALVTDLSLHIRATNEGRLVWVTSLSTGKPVAGADVSAPGKNGLVHVRTDADGLALVPSPSSEGDVVVRKDDDIAFIPVEPPDLRIYEYFHARREDLGPEVYATVFDTMLLQPGATLHMKHLHRSGTSRGLVLPLETGAKPAHIAFVHQGGNRTYSTELAWEHGQVLQDWTAPPDAPLGDYAVSVDGHPSGSFRIEPFSTAQTSASVDGPLRVYPGTANRTLVLSVTQLNGGAGQGKASMRIGQDKTWYQPGIVFPGYGNTAFGNGLPSNARQTGEDIAPAILHAELDRRGQARFELPAIPADVQAATFWVEFGYPDANGDTHTLRRDMTLLPAAEVLGIEADRDPQVGDPLEVTAIALDADGHPLADRDVRLTRVLPGQPSPGEAEICAGKTDAEGKLRCALARTTEESVTIVARNRTAAGQPIAANLGRYWRLPYEGEKPRLSLSAPRQPLAPGDTARIDLHRGFTNGWMLVTVEREGVLSARVVRVDGKTDHVDVPVTPAFAPNVTVNVLQLRGYHDTPDGEPLHQQHGVDLYVKPDVQALRVAVQADRASYQPGQEASVKVAVTTADGSPLPARAELALAVVDEGLLQLWDNTSWDLLHTMMRERRIPVQHKSASPYLVLNGAHLTSLRQPEPRGMAMSTAPLASSRGDAPAAPAARMNFQPQVLWRGSVQLDANGRATLPVRLNDALSRFRIVAIAQAGDDRFGHGSTDVITRQTIELRPQLPAIVRGGDRLVARVLLRNTQERRTAVSVTSTLRYPDGTQATLPAQDVTLVASGTRELQWPIKVPENAKGPLTWTLQAQAGDESDHVQATLTVLAPERQRVLQAALVQLDHPLTLPLRLPTGATNGQLTISLSGALDAGLAGVHAFFDDYPYAGVEQRLSRAAAFDDHAGWDAFLANANRYVDQNRQLLRYYPEDGVKGSDVLTEYVLDLSHATGFALPEQLQRTLLDGLRRHMDTPAGQDQHDAELRRVANLARLAEHEMAPTSMIDRTTPRLNAWPVVTLVDWMAALRNSPEQRHKVLLAEAASELRTRLVERNGTLDILDDRLEVRPWFMTDADVSLARLILVVADLPEWRGDLPQLARALMARQHDGHWKTTTANAWGAIAIRRVMRLYGSAAVTGATSVTVGPEQRTLSWERGAPAAQLPLAAGPSTLTLTHTGTGTPWAALQVTAMAPLQGSRFNGLRVRKTVTPLEQKVPGRWSRGDLVRVDLEVESPHKLESLVLDDPLPPGAVVQGSLGGQTKVVEEPTDSSWEYRERAPEALRVYRYELWSGVWKVSYAMRLNAEGEFRLPATHVEAMYQPEVSGDVGNAGWKVR